MGRIKNTSLYPLKGTPNNNDTIVGNDNEDGGKTVTFRLGSLLAQTGEEGNFVPKGGYTGTAQDIVDLIPTKTSELDNDGSAGSSTFVEASDLADVATSGSYNDLSDIPDQTAPTLQQVLEAGKTAFFPTMEVLFNEDFIGFTEIDPSDSSNQSAVQLTYNTAAINSSFGEDSAEISTAFGQPYMMRTSAGINTTLRFQNPQSNISVYIPTKSEIGEYTLATLDDIVVPNLQQVLNEGSSATKGDSSVNLFAGDESSGYAHSVITSKDAQQTAFGLSPNDATLSGSDGTKNSDIRIELGEIVLSKAMNATPNQTVIRVIDPVAVTNLSFPAKPEGDYTLATTDDIQTVGLQEVLDETPLAVFDGGGSQVFLGLGALNQKQSGIVHSNGLAGESSATATFGVAYNGAAYILSTLGNRTASVRTIGGAFSVLQNSGTKQQFLYMEEPVAESVTMVIPAPAADGTYTFAFKEELPENSLQDVIDVNKTADRVEFLFDKIKGGRLRGTYLFQSDYKVNTLNPNQIYLYGGFESHDEVSSKYITRMNADGTKDLTFNVGTGFNTYPFAGCQMLVGADGKVYVSGGFNSYNGTPAKGIISLNPDGTVNTFFNYGTGFEGNGGYTVGMAFSNDGTKIYVTGSFFTYNGTPAVGIVRLNLDGSIDSSFVSGAGFSGGYTTTVDVLVNPDDSILVSGYHTTYKGVSSIGLTKVLPNGDLDTSFNSGSGFNTSNLQPNFIFRNSVGILMAYGYFTSYNGVSSNRIIAINEDGTANTETYSFGTGFPNTVNEIHELPTGKYLASGSFTSYNGTTTNNVVVLNSDFTISDTFATGYRNGFGIVNQYAWQTIVGQTYRQIISLEGGMPITKRRLTFDEVTGKAEYHVGGLDGITSEELLPKRLVEKMVTDSKQGIDEVLHTGFVTDQEVDFVDMGGDARVAINPFIIQVSNATGGGGSQMEKDGLVFNVFGVTGDTKLLGSNEVGNYNYVNLPKADGTLVLQSEVKNEAGQVKVNYTGLTTTGFTAEVVKTLDINAATPVIVGSPTTIYPTSTTNSYEGIFDATRGVSPTGRLIENPVNGQVHTWRLQISYANKASGNNGALDILFTNPVSGFQYVISFTLPTGRTSGVLNDIAITIADGASIPSPDGYVIQARTSFSDATLEVGINSITRISHSKKIDLTAVGDAL